MLDLYVISVCVCNMYIYIYIYIYMIYILCMKPKRLWLPCYYQPTNGLMVKHTLGDVMYTLRVRMDRNFINKSNKEHKKTGYN